MSRYANQGDIGQGVMLVLYPDSDLKSALDTELASATGDVTKWKIAFDGTSNNTVKYPAANGFHNGHIERCEPLNGSPYYALTCWIYQYQDGSSNIHAVTCSVTEYYAGTATLGEGTLTYASGGTKRVTSSDSGGGYIYAVDEPASNYLKVLK